MKNSVKMAENSNENSGETYSNAIEQLLYEMCCIRHLNPIPRTPEMKIIYYHLKLAVMSALEQYTTTFHDMYKTIETKLDGNLLEETMNIIATDIFANGVVNWGRVVAFIAFISYTTQMKFEKNQSHDYISTISVHLSACLKNSMKDYIENLGPWTKILQS